MPTLWKKLHPNATPEMLGFIPEFLDPFNPRSAREQLDANYPFGGFQPFPGFTMAPNGDLLYPGDPPLKAIAETKIRDETVRVYHCSWVAVIQPDGTFEVCRLD